MSPKDEIGASGKFVEAPEAVLGTIRRKVAELADAAISLVRGRGLPTCADAMRTLERAVIGLFGRYADEITAAVVGAAQGATELAAAVAARPADAPPMRAHGVRPVEIRLLGGSRITVSTRYSAPDYSDRPGPRKAARGTSGTGCYPFLDHLGFVERATPALSSEVARQSAALSSFREAEDGLGAQGIDLDVKTIRRLSEFCGERALRARDALVEAFARGERWAGGEFAGKRVAAVFDGGRTRTRVSGKRGRRRRKSRRRGFQTPWREPKVLAIYEFDRKGRKTGHDPIYEGTFECWDDAFRIFTALCARRGVSEAAEFVVAGDGSDNIWDRIDGFICKLGIDPARVTRVIDFYHASEHVAKLAGLCAQWSEKRRQCWIARAMRHLKAGRIEKVIESGEELKIGRRSPAVEKALDYFRKRKDSMRYAAFRGRGLPIGSGVVESAIRRIVNLRLKGPGIFWEVDNAERMLILRARLKSNRWHELETDIAAAAGPRRLLPRERTRAAA